MPSEGNARAAQLAPSAVTECSRTICHQKCGWPGLSDDERLVEEHARSRGVELNMMASLTETCSVGCVSSWWLRRHVADSHSTVWAADDDAFDVSFLELSRTSTKVAREQPTAPQG
eukprot:scaffold64511_cov56-Phaeocystis_antarctica.AAC.1